MSGQAIGTAPRPQGLPSSREREEIADFLECYVHALDDGRIDDWSGFFTHDATYQVTTRENVERGLPLGIVLCEGRGESPGGGTSNMLMTLGYDPKKKSFVGTFIGSMSSYMWIYETGTLDATESALTFECDGPDFEHEGKLKRYRDTIEWKSDDHRVLRAQVQGDDGTWTEMMTSHYRRTK